jgi:hypothetical protein
MGLALGLLFLFSLSGRVVINEVMADPEGPESGEGSPGDRNEFVELYNQGGVPVDLSGARLTDRNETDSLIRLRGSGPPVLEPGGFALILDPEYFEPGSHRPEPYDFPETTLLLTTRDLDIGGYGLSSKDWLVLLDAHGEVRDTYGTPDDSLDGIPPPTEDGVSVERRDAGSGDREGNWRLSRFGCTPGRPNSVSFPVDLGLSPSLIRFDPELPEPGDPVRLTVTATNFGLTSVFSFELAVRTDLGTIERDVETVLHPDDTSNVRVGLQTLSEGAWPVMITLFHPEDGYRPNDSIDVTLQVGRAGVVINEIMYDDDPEWVELFNRGPNERDLTGWTLEDASGSITPPFDPFVLPSGGFCVLVEDTAAFRRRFGPVDWISASSLPTLNNSEEELRLRDSTGTLREKASYRSTQGGGEGVSLERISPELPSGLEDAWTGSLHPTGGTPGRVNSVYVAQRGGSARLELSSKLFTPDGDGERDVLLVSYQLPAFPSEVALYVFDSSGRLVDELCQGRSGAGTGTAVWDGCSRTGRRLPTGLYIVYLEARAGGRSYRNKSTVALRR